MADAILNEVSVTNLFDLTGVVAVVTGGGSGIGLMISTTLMSNGATVYIIGLNQAELDKVAKTYNDAAERMGKKGRIYGIEGNISKKSEAIRLAEELQKRTPYITVLFNNAGVFNGEYVRPKEATVEAFQKAYLEDLTEGDFETAMHTNAVGPYWTTFAFLPLLTKWKEMGYRATANGRKFAPQVIMTSSMNGWTKDAATSGFTFPYMYSKSAIGHATETIAHELLQLGIRVNGIAPGLFPTEMNAKGTADELGQSRFTHHKFEFDVPCTQPPSDDGSQPLAAGSRTDVGAVVLALVTNWFINGETILVDGGTLLRHPSSW